MKQFKLNEKKICASVATPMIVLTSMITNAFAAGTFDSAVSPVVELLQQLTGPALTIVGAIGTLYCILLGVKFAPLHRLWLLRSIERRLPENLTRIKVKSEPRPVREKRKKRKQKDPDAEKHVREKKQKSKKK